MRVILRGTAAFLKTRGWWPTTQELATAIRSSKYAVWWFYDANKADGLMKRFHERTGDIHALMLTARGWAALDMEPLVPRRKRPSADLKSRVAERVLRDVIRELGET